MGSDRSVRPGSLKLARFEEAFAMAPALAGLEIFKYEARAVALPKRTLELQCPCRPYSSCKRAIRPPHPSERRQGLTC